MSDYKTVNPATGETVREFPTLDAAGVEQALARVTSGFATWRATPVEDRAEVVTRIAELFVERERRARARSPPRRWASR